MRDINSLIKLANVSKQLSISWLSYEFRLWNEINQRFFVIWIHVCGDVSQLKLFFSQRTRVTFFIRKNVSHVTNIQRLRTPYYVLYLDEFYIPSKTSLKMLGKKLDDAVTSILDFSQKNFFDNFVSHVTWNPLYISEPSIMYTKNNFDGL